MTARIPLARSAAIRILTSIQNCAHFAHQDILTFTGFMSDAEVREHVWSCFRRLSDADKRTVLDLARDILKPAPTPA